MYIVAVINNIRTHSHVHAHAGAVLPGALLHI